MTLVDDKFKYEFKLNALLEITQKINENIDEDEMYSMYRDKLEGLMDLTAMALFVFDRKWELKVNFGVGEDIKRITGKILKFNELTFLDGDETDEYPFNVIIPIFYTDKKLAVVCLSYEEGQVEDEQLPFIKALSNMMFVALEHNKMLKRELEQKELEKEMEIAGEVQAMLVPKNLPKSKHIEMNATYIPHHLIGGDYYDCIQINKDKYLLCIADVSGKGVPAALLMSNFQATLKALTHEGLGLEEIVIKLNKSVFEVTEGDRYITAFFAIYDDANRTIQYINAGHNLPFFMDKEKRQMQKLKEGTTMLGAFEELPFLNQGNLELHDYTLLFLYTDGLVEIFDEYGAEFGEIGLEHFLKTESTKSLQAMHEELLDLILSYSTAGYQDDITILTCKFRF